MTASPPGPAAEPDAPGARLSRSQIVAILGALMAGIFLAALDQTIVATAIRTIADDLSGLSMQASATTAYLITATISTPLYGKLSDIYGRKPLFVIAISVFVVGSLLCSLTESMSELAAARAVQGAGAGGLFSLALAIVGDIVPPRERARYQGFFLAVFGSASVLGPVIGGFFAGADSLLGISGWRWVFLVNVPVGLAALALVLRVLRLPHTYRRQRIDVGGAALLAAGVVPILLVAQQARDWGWTSALTLGLLVVSAVSLVGFVAVERRLGDDALLPPRLFRLPTFAVGSATSLVLGMAMFGGLASLPLYLQIVKGQSPTEAGLTLLPLTAGIMVGSVVSGQLISATGRYRVLPVTGCFLLLTSLVLFAQVEADTALWQTGLVMALFGLGLGGNLQPLVLAVQNAVPATDIGVATSSVTFSRQMGGALGTAVFMSILFTTAGTRIAERFGEALATPSFRAVLADPAVAADPANAAVISQLSGADDGAGVTQEMAVTGTGVLDDSSFLAALDPRLAVPFQAGFTDAVQTLFWAAAAVMTIGCVLVLFLPELPLRERSALDEREDALAREAAEERA